MEGYPCVTEVLPQNSMYQTVGGEYFIPVQQQQQIQIYPAQQQVQIYPVQQQQPSIIPIQQVPPNNVLVQLKHNVAKVNQLGNGTKPVGVAAKKQLQVTDGNLTAGNGVYMLNSNYRMRQPGTNDKCGNVNSVKSSNIGQVGAQQCATRKPPASHTQLNDNRNSGNANRNNYRKDYQNSRQSESNVKRMIKIPDPKQMKTGIHVREKIGGLKVDVSGTFLSWNVTGRTVLDLNFMRNLFYLTNIDINFQPNFSHELGIYDGLKKVVQNDILSDWLVLKCEEKQMSFYNVNDQIEIYSVSNFGSLLSTIAQESCLPLPFITTQDNKFMYFYLNFPKSANNRVKKLNMPVFHDADNGRKKVPCKYPGIRLDCTFETAIQQIVIYVQQSAVPVYMEYVSYIRQVIVYNHMVWGFLQAWIRGVRDHCNGCFKMQDIAENLSLCVDDLPETRKSLTSERDFIYNINYLNLYLKFDPVPLKDTAVSFKIENFETNFVCDVAIVQYYRQFFLVNDMHYSDALKNVVLFSKENGSSNVAEFVYTTNAQDKASRSQDGFFMPNGINRSSPQQQTPVTGGNPVESNVRTVQDVQGTKQTRQCSNPTVANGHVAPSSNSEQVPRTNPVAENPPLSKPLIKTRTVEEINSSVEMKKNLNGSEVSFDSILSDKTVGNAGDHPPPSYIRQALRRCYVMNMVEICKEDVTRDPKVARRIFHDALIKAMGMKSVEDFIQKLYVTLQKYFTNSSCQIIMNGTIQKALEKRFPGLKVRSPYQNSVGGELHSSAGNTTGESIPQQSAKASETQKGVSVPPPQQIPPERVGEVKGNKNPPAKQVVTSPKKTQPNPKPQHQPGPKTVDLTGPETKASFPPPVGPPEQAPQSGTVKEQNPILQSISSAESPVKSSPKPNTTQKPNNVTPNEEPNSNVCSDMNKNRETSELVKSPKKVQGNLERVTKPKKDAEEVAKASATVVENGNNISIKLRLSLSRNADDSVGGDTIPDKGEEEPKTSDGGDEVNQRVEVSTEEGNHPVQRVETSFLRAEEEKEQNLFARYNIKPCSVVLNAKDYENYLKKQKRVEKPRKRRRKSHYAPQSSPFDDEEENSEGDDQGDRDFVVSVPKKRMKISELEYLEARTRVLQRLRRRHNNQVASKNGESMYTAEELEQFFMVHYPIIQGMETPSAKETQKEESDPEEAKYQALRKECLTRKATVVIERLKDLSENRKETSKWRVETKANGRLTLTRDYSEEYDSLPMDKRKYFEVKDGKLYLKEQYQVKNGRIIPINPGIEEIRINPKDEPPSVYDELDFSSSVIKRERFPE